MSKTDVLLVDDDQDHAELVRLTLERHSGAFEVTHVPDGPACLDALASRRYAVVLLDYSLPRMNGLEVLAGIRERGITVPVVLATSQGDERIAGEAMAAGAIDYVVKTPGYFKALPLVLNKVLRQHELSLENAWLLAETEAHRARLAQILDSTADGILLLEETGVVMSANRRAGELLAFDPAQAMGRPLTAILTPHFPGRSAEQVAGVVERLLHNLALSGEADMELPASGAVLEWTRRASTDGVVTPGPTLSFRDVTHARKVERMKTDFVSFVTHQLRTPLSGIKWMLELAREEPTAETASDYLHDAAGAAERLITMVNELLTITRLEAGRLTADFKSLDLAVLTRTTVDDVKALVAAKGMDLTVVASPAPVHGDPQLLQQLLATLVSNAVKYTPAWGRIDISIETSETTVLWAICDTGVGIPKADQPRVFEKFYRADNVVPLDTEGTGLGLHLARLIAEQFGGRLWFESLEGLGSTFFVELPRDDGANAALDMERAATDRGGPAS